MKPADRAGSRRWLLVPAAALVLSGLAAGCSSSKPAYCTDAANLKTSVSDLGNVDVAKNGLSSLQTALSSVQADAKIVRHRREVGVPVADRGAEHRACPACRPRSRRRRASLR